MMMMLVIIMTMMMLMIIMTDDDNDNDVHDNDNDYYDKIKTMTALTRPHVNVMPALRRDAVAKLHQLCV